MKKHFSWITALIIAVSVFLGISCSQEVETEVDKTAPKEVTNFTVTVKDNAFYLSWINPDDADFAGIQISMSPAEGILSTPISLGKDETSFSVSGLTVGKDYKFTIKTFDTNLNYSDGQTVVKRIENKTEDTTPEKPEDPDNPSDLEDTTPSVSVSNLNAVYDANTLSILVSWTNPKDEDFAGVEITYAKENSEYTESLFLDKSHTYLEIKDIAADDSEYLICVQARALSGNYGRMTRIYVSAVNTEPVITSVEIPDMGESFGKGCLIPVIIKGKNLVGYKITSDEPSFRCVEYISNTLIRAEIESPGDVGRYEVKVNYGDASGIGVFNVIKCDYDYSVGDILFTDGTRIKAENVGYGIPEVQKTKAFGVIIGFNYYRTNPVVVGLKESSPIQWSPIETTDYDLNFTGIQGTGKYRDFNGSDNWDYICSVDPEGSKDAATNYPAFNFANTYGNFAGLTGTEYAEGWYLPSCVELSWGTDAKPYIQRSLDALGGLSIGEKYYWSSSSYGSRNGSICVVDCISGDNSYGYNHNLYNVLVMKTLTTESFRDYEYEAPEITSIEIPTIGKGYAGDFDVIINGNNFCGPNFDINQLYCSKTPSSVKVINPEKIRVSFSATLFNGCSEDITFSIGSSSVTGRLNFVEYDYYSVGDILFTDGTRIKYENVKYGMPESQRSKAFGVVAGLTKYGTTPLIVGIKEGDGLQWSVGTCSNKNFIEIQGSQFYGDMYGGDNWEYICSVDPEGTKDAATNYPAFNFANTYGEFAGLKGTEYADGWYLPSIAELYGVFKNYDSFLIINRSSASVADQFAPEHRYWSCSQSESNDASAEGFYLSKNYGPNQENQGYLFTSNKSSSYCVRVMRTLNFELFNDYEYGIPEITSVEIPTVKAGYTGYVLITINGNNLCGPNIKDQLYCSKSLSDISLNGEKIKAQIYCNGYSEDVTFSIGSSNVTATLIVAEPEPEPEPEIFTEEDIGKIVLSDGTLVAKEDFNSSTMKPVAVIAGFKNNGRDVIAIGLKCSSSALVWAKKGTIGYNTNFTELYTDQSYDYDLEEYIITGNVDGAYNWDYICSVDPEGTQDAAINYPAFNFANTYGEFAGLTGTKYTDGWYLPTIAELEEIRKNRNIIQATLDVVGGFKIVTSSVWYYLSSNQCDGIDDIELETLRGSWHMNVGGVLWEGKASKSNQERVLVIRTF